MQRFFPALLFAFAVVVSIASASTNQLTLMVGFAAGGTSSTAARIFADSVGAITGVTPIVENRPGAGGQIAADAVRAMRGRPVLLFMSSTSVLKVVPGRDLEPIGIIATFPYVAVARKDASQTLHHYMEAAKESDRWRFVATAGAGSVPHLIAEKLFEEHGLKMTHIPFQGSSPAILSVLGGHVPLAIVPLPDFLPFQDSLSIIARSGDGIEESGWIGLYAPKGSTDDEIRALARLFERASSRSAQRLSIFGFHSTWLSGEGLLRQHESEYVMWLALSRRLGIQH
jgi:tripartite-type tricarboxylate transporter receptor subunit TctC